MFNVARYQKQMARDSNSGTKMNMTPDLPFLNIHNPFTNERIIIYSDKHSRMSFDTKPLV